jgi:hypothetical protein
VPAPIVAVPPAVITLVEMFPANAAIGTMLPKRVTIMKLLFNMLAPL